MRKFGHYERRETFLDFESPDERVFVCLFVWVGGRRHSLIDGDEVLPLLKAEAVEPTEKNYSGKKDI